MKTQDSMRADEANQTPSPLFPAARITKLLLDLKASLGQAEGQPLSYDEWAQIAGRPANTIASWCAGGTAHQLEVLLASLKRLTAEERHRLIDRACRDYPTLRHPKLAHDFVACSHLATLLRQPSGLTLIQGAPEHMRTFLVNALGNSASSPDLKKAAVAGVDMHQPDLFVPVIGLTYLGNLLRAGDIEREFKRVWPAVCAAKAWLILLNGVWPQVPALQSEILDSARKSHVVIADALTLNPAGLKSRVSTPVHMVTVSPSRERPDWLRVEIQAF
jgi:hypothetical protein